MRKSSPLDMLLTALDAYEGTTYPLMDIAREAYHKHSAIMAFESAEEIKQKYEEWEPKRTAALAELGEYTERGVKARVFYHCLDSAYDKHRVEIRKLLAAEREAGITPASARVALEQHEKQEAAEAGTASGAGGWVGEVLKYMYEEKEVPK